MGMWIWCRSWTNSFHPCHKVYILYISKKQILHIFRFGFDTVASGLLWRGLLGCGRCHNVSVGGRGCIGRCCGGTGQVQIGLLDTLACVRGQKIKRLHYARTILGTTFKALDTGEGFFNLFQFTCWYQCGFVLCATQIRLVGHNNNQHFCWCLLLNLLNPNIGQIVKGFTIGNVKYQYNAVSALVVGIGEGSKAFLTLLKTYKKYIFFVRQYPKFVLLSFVHSSRQSF